MRECSVEGCSNKILAKNYCIMHYQRAKRGVPLDKPVMMKSTTGLCSVDGCGKRHHANGFCQRHNKKMKKYGTPFGVHKSIVNEWILGHLSYAGDDCLIWPYACSKSGYGQIRVDGETEYVHVVICTIVHGAKPSASHIVRHKCGNGHGGCVSPRCVCWSTNSENQMDRVEHGTSNRGERHGRSKLKEFQIISIVNDDRHNRVIAAEYGVEHSVVARIKRGESWSWLTGISSQPKGAAQ